MRDGFRIASSGDAVARNLNGAATLALLGLSLLAWNPTSGEDASAPRVAKAAAEQWLALIDAGKYKESWVQSCEWTRTNLEMAQWQDHLKFVRLPRGAPIIRNEKKSDHIMSTKGIPDQEGAYIQYGTFFEDGDFAMETVGLTLEVDGRWRPVTYVLSQPRSGDIDSHDYMEIGSAFYLLEIYAKSAELYSEALILEKKQRQLAEDLFKVLIDNLGMSYGLVGDLEEAKETFEYGLTLYPKYPMFQYNLACTYAEMNDLGNAISYLKRAFKHEEYMIPGEEMPDPSKDSSFARFLKDERFQVVLKQIGAQ